MRDLIALLGGGLFFWFVGNANAEGYGEDISHAEVAAFTFLWIAILLLIAKTASLVEKFGQPAVLGELIAGVILGNLTLIGIHLFDQIKSDQIILFLAELGVVILLFQIGLESNIKDMRKVGIPAFLVACIGVVVPFGKGLGVVSDEVFSVIVIMVIFSTLLTPPILTILIKRQKEVKEVPQYLEPPRRLHGFSFNNFAAHWISPIRKNGLHLLHHIHLPYRRERKR